MKRIWIMVMIMLLSGCSAQWHMRRAIEKDASILQVDTVRTADTVYVEAARMDTVFKYRFDTVEFWKDSIRVKYFYEVEDSLVYLDVDCPDNEVITKTETVTNTIRLEPTWGERAKWFGAGMLALLFLLALLVLVRLKK